MSVLTQESYLLFPYEPDEKYLSLGTGYCQTDIKFTLMPTHYDLVLELNCSLYELSSLKCLAIIPQFSFGLVQS